MIPTPTPFTEITNGAMLLLHGIGGLAAGIALCAAFTGALLILLLPEGQRDVWFIIYAAGVLVSLILSMLVGNWWWFATAAAVMPIFLGIRWLYRRYVDTARW